MEIGPILGILSIPRINGSPFVGGQNESFAEIISAAERLNCTAFVFSPLDIDWSKKAVWGYRYNVKAEPPEWERLALPIPTIIYNRIPNRTLENREDIKNPLASLMQKYGPRFFNPCFLDKWRTHKILFNNRKTRPFLPETRMLQDYRDIIPMLDKFGAVYLKPTANSLGHEMMRVSKTADGRHYYIHQTLNQEPRTGVTADCREILAGLPLAGDNGYLVQQAISLARFNGSPFDLRLLVQKDRHANWCKTGIAARAAGKDSITTHVFYGGVRFPAEKVLQSTAEKYRFPIKHIKDQLRQIQSTIPMVIEKSYEHSFGELEMDVGIDQKGKVWFFEANSKPFRFDEKLIRAKSLIRLIHYVKYLDSLGKT